MWPTEEQGVTTHSHTQYLLLSSRSTDDLHILMPHNCTVKYPAHSLPDVHVPSVLLD